MLIVGLGLSVMRHIPTPARSLTYVFWITNNVSFVDRVIAGAHLSRPSATLPYEGRDWATSVANGNPVTPLSS